MHLIRSLQSRQPSSFPLKLRYVSPSSTQGLRRFGTGDPFFVSLCQALRTYVLKTRRARLRKGDGGGGGDVCLNYSKCISGALACLGVVTGVIDNVDAATQEAPELPKCEHCGHAEAEQPGCILICKGCAVESNDWRDASAKHKCFKVCEDCCSCRVSSATKRLPAERNTRILPR